MTGLDYYVKEFSRIQMDPSQTIIIDNQPISYSLNKGMLHLILFR
jgi:TFIIF-interacting CTD phosphatase-like protein